MLVHLRGDRSLHRVRRRYDTIAPDRLAIMDDGADVDDEAIGLLGEGADHPVAGDGTGIRLHHHGTGLVGTERKDRVGVDAASSGNEDLACVRRLGGNRHRCCGVAAPAADRAILRGWVLGVGTVRLRRRHDHIRAWRASAPLGKHVVDLLRIGLLRLLIDLGRGDRCRPQLLTRLGRLDGCRERGLNRRRDRVRPRPDWAADKNGSLRVSRPRDRRISRRRQGLRRLAWSHGRRVGGALVQCTLGLLVRGGQGQGVLLGRAVEAAWKRVHSLEPGIPRRSAGRAARRAPP